MEEIVLISSDSSPPSSPVTYKFDSNVNSCSINENPHCSSQSGESGFLSDVQCSKLSKPVKKMKISCYHAMSDSENEVEFLSHGGKYTEENFKGQNDEPFISNSLPSLASYEVNYKDIDIDDISNKHMDPYSSEYSSSQAFFSQESRDSNNKSPKKTRITKEERQKIKEQKIKEKAEKMSLVEKLRQMKPGECLKYVTANIDRQLSETYIGSKALENLKETGTLFKVVDHAEPFSITWTRKLPSAEGDTEQKEDHILIVWSSERIVTSIQYCTLLETFKTINKNNHGCRISLAIYGLNGYYRKLKPLKPADTSSQLSTNDGPKKGRKRKSTDQLPSRDQVEMALAELEVILGISNRLLDTHEDLSTFLQQFTKAIAETPFRKERHKKDDSKSWYARGDSRDCVRVDKDLNGLYRLWLQQLSQLNKSSLDTAKSIAEVYPTPYSLLEAYDKCPSQKERDLLLQNIQIQRSSCVQPSARKIGPKLSKKISLLFTQYDGDVLISKD